MAEGLANGAGEKDETQKKGRGKETCGRKEFPRIKTKKKGKLPKIVGL